MKRSDIKKRAEELAAQGEDELTVKERAFVAHYLSNFNAAESHRLTGYEGVSQNAAKAHAYEIMQKPAVRKAINKHLADMYMPVAELEARLSEIARGSIDSIADVGEDGAIRYNWKKAKENGALMLVKKMKVTTRKVPNGTKEPSTETTEYVELHDPLVAIDYIAKIKALYKAPVEVPLKPGEGPLEAMGRAYEEGLRADKSRKAHAVQTHPRK